MRPLTEAAVAAIFHHLAEFLRKTGDLGIFDTLVHNYRLKESLSLSQTKLEDFSRDLLQLITTVQNLLNTNKSLSEINPGHAIPFNHSVVENGNRIPSATAENSIEINWTGSMSMRQNGQKKRRKIIKVNNIDKVVSAPNPEVAVSDDLLGIFSCRTCSRFYKSKNSYQSHPCPKNKKSSHDESEAQLITDINETKKLRRFVCGICFQAVQTYDRIISHLAKCEGGPYTCEFCESNGVSEKALFDSLKGLNRHKRTEHPNTKCFACNECDLSFQRKQSLAKHKRARHEKHSYSCPSCDQVFDRRINLTNHKLRHHTEVKRCDHCGIGCASDAALSAHIALKHNSETAAVTVKKFTCNFCQKEFPRKDKLEFHLSIHTGVKPFICTTCGKTFSRKFKLEDHEARHLGIKKYPCTHPNCNKAYASNADLKIHSMKHHPCEGVVLPDKPQPAAKRRRKKKSVPPPPVAPEPSMSEILLLEVNSEDFPSVETPVEGLLQGISPFPAFSEEIIERLPLIGLEIQQPTGFTMDDNGEMDYEYDVGDRYFISDAVPDLPSTTGDEYSMAIESNQQELQFIPESLPYPQNFYQMENNDNNGDNVVNNSDQNHNQYPYHSEIQEFHNTGTTTMGNTYLSELTPMDNLNMAHQYDYPYHRKSTSTSAQPPYAQDFGGSGLASEFQYFQSPFPEQ